jgi:DNA-binding response OmpR family regulator
VLGRLLEADRLARVLLVSGFPDETDWKAYRNAGALGLLRKPFTVRELNRAVRQALGLDRTPSSPPEELAALNANRY